MPKIPSPSPALSQAAATVGRDLRRLAFDGDTAGFAQRWGTYLREFGAEDPHGRCALNLLLNESSGLLGFRTLSTDRQQIEEAQRLRWGLWLPILPLDMQLPWLFMDAATRDITLVDWSTVRWDVRNAVVDAADPEQAFRRSSLGGWRDDGTPGPGSPRTMEGDTPLASRWSEEHRYLLSDGYFLAARFVDVKAWPTLEAWMEAARLSACAHVPEFYACYRTANVTGMTWLKTIQPLPFWATCLFLGAVEPRFWRAMARAGGPDGPEWGAPWSERSEPPPALHAPAAAPPEALDPIAWLDPIWAAALPSEILSQTRRTAAAWRERRLESALKARPDPSRRPARL